MQLYPMTDDYPYYTPYQFADNDPIANVDLDGLEPLGVVGQTANATNTLIGVIGGGTSTLVGAGTSAEHWESTFNEVFVIGKHTAKAAAFTIKPVLITTLSLSMNVLHVVDNVMVLKPPIQDVSLQQRKTLSVTIHDKLDPAHPIALGVGDGPVVGDEKRGYSKIWKTQGIQEDNGFWLCLCRCLK